MRIRKYGQVQRVLDERKIKEETDHTSTAHQMSCGYSVTITKEKVIARMETVENGEITVRRHIAFLLHFFPHIPYLLVVFVKEGNHYYLTMKV